MTDSSGGSSGGGSARDDAWAGQSNHEPSGSANSDSGSANSDSGSANSDSGSADSGGDSGDSGDTGDSGDSGDIGGGGRRRLLQAGDESFLLSFLSDAFKADNNQQLKAAAQAAAKVTRTPVECAYARALAREGDW